MVTYSGRRYSNVYPSLKDVNITFIISIFSTIDQWIAQFLIASDAEQHVIVAHGSAIPFVADIAQNVLLHKSNIKISFVLSNGPLLGVDISNSPIPVCRKCFNICLSFLLHFQNVFSLFYAFFRRLVINPYVMNSDMIVALCSPVFSNRQKTQKCIEYINDYSNSFPIDIPLFCDFPLFYVGVPWMSDIQ